MGTDRALAVFVYGTLKRGFENHAHYCRGVSEVLPASTWGRLHLWSPGIPILSVPRELVLLIGSPDAEADLRSAVPFLEGERALREQPARSGGWRRIEGQLLRFPDPVRRLSLLDALES